MIALVFSPPCFVALRRVVAYLLNVSALHRSLRASPDNENTARNFVLAFSPPWSLCCVVLRFVDRSVTYLMAVEVISNE